MLTKSQILGIVDLSQKEVKVPEWNGVVVIKELTGRQRDILEGMFASRMNPKTGQIMSTKDMRAKMVVMSVIDEKGEYMFTDKDIEALSGKSAKALDRIVDAINELNGISQEEIEESAGN